MKQKIVIEVPLCCDKRKSKAMQIAVAANGVTSASVELKANKMVVIGDGVDSTRLTTSLRKKLGYANVLIVEEVKPPAPTEKTKEPAKKKEETSMEPISQWPAQPCCHSSYSYGECYICYKVCDPDPPFCTII